LLGGGGGGGVIVFSHISKQKSRFVQLARQFDSVVTAARALTNDSQFVGVYGPFPYRHPFRVDILMDEDGHVSV
jgi:hypothetical protein